MLFGRDSGKLKKTKIFHLDSDILHNWINVLDRLVLLNWELEGSFNHIAGYTCDNNFHLISPLCRRYSIILTERFKRESPESVEQNRVHKLRHKGNSELRGNRECENVATIKREIQQNKGKPLRSAQIQILKVNDNRKLFAGVHCVKYVLRTCLDHRLDRFQHLHHQLCDPVVRAHRVRSMLLLHRQGEEEINWVPAFHCHSDQLFHSFCHSKARGLRFLLSECCRTCGHFLLQVRHCHGVHSLLGVYRLAFPD